MLTIFSTTKPFDGHIGIIQRNALASWARVCPDVQILLFGEEAGVADAAAEIGAQHVKTVERNEHGTPLLSSVFGQAEKLARHQFLCYANADIIFMSDLLPALQRVSAWRERFLMVGECWNLDVSEALPVGNVGWEEALRARVRQEGRWRGRSALDWFVFPRGGYARWLPLALGRAGFDNWLLWEARAEGAAVVEVSSEVAAVHQNHQYGHLAGGFAESRQGEEARRNCEMAGGMKRMLTLDDATHRLEGGEVRSSWGRVLRLAHRRTRLKHRLKKWVGHAG